MTSRVNGERQKTPYDLVLDEVYSLKSRVETAGYGKNKAAVRDAIKDQTLLQAKVDEYGQEVEKMVAQTEDEAQKKGLQEAYQKLKDVTEQKLNCLNTMLEISTLEEHCSALGETFDRRAVQLVDLEGRERDAQGENLQGFMAPSSQDCVFAAEDNWNYLSSLVKCLDIHLKNDAQYQQFFHECDESSVWMLQDLKRLHDAFEISPLKGDYQDAERLTQEIQDMTLALRQWEVKTDYLWEQARRVVPVQKRITPTDEPLPARALCSYETKEGKIRENEDLLVIDNTEPQQWRVRNARGDEFSVPALTILVPGPFKEAIDAAVKMRLQLLAAWTNTLKRVGQRLITFMLLVFKNKYENDEIQTLRSIPSVEKNELARVLDFVEETLKVHWQDHQGFQALQERVLMLRMMLEETQDKDADEESYKSLVVQILVLEKLMQKYRDMWREWEKYKTSLEASRAPELMLIVDKWEQLKFVTRDYFTKFWQNNLPIDELRTLKITDITGEEEEEAGMYEEGFSEERVEVTETSVVSEKAVKAHAAPTLTAAPDMSSFEEGMFEERIEETTTSYTEASAAVDEVEGSEFGMATERKIAETEQLSKAEQEEVKRFVIRSVINTETDEEISLDEAIMLGLINPSEGIYINKKTGETYPIPVAMGAGLIKVDFTTTKRSEEKKSSVGIITVKTIRETVRPYDVVGVRDLESGETVDKAEAARRGILNEANGTFLDKTARKKFLIADAIDKGFVQVEYKGEAPEPEVISQSYAVRAVVDTRRKKVITFQDAVRQGIIDRDSGAFRDNKTGETMYIGDAIMRGFLKARKIDDPNSLDINPENKVLIDRTEKIRQKILRPLRVLGAFRKAAMMASNNK